MPNFENTNVVREVPPPLPAEAVAPNPKRNHRSRRNIPKPLSNTEKAWFDTPKKKQESDEFPESERVETAEAIMKLKKPQMEVGPKVILSPEAAKTREQHQREKQEQERVEKVHEIQTQLRGNGVEKIARRSENERSLVNDIVQEMRTHIDRGDATESTLGHYRRELVDLQSAIEQLQSQALESDHGTKGIAASHEINEIMSANFEALTKISSALHASKLERGAAQKELSPFTTVANIPEGEKSAKMVEESIEEKYGADPEALRAGGGSFLKRTLFNFRHWLAQKTNQKSEYDHYRDAKTREYAQKNVPPAPTTSPEPEEEDLIPKPLESLVQELETSERLTKKISIEDARQLVPRASQLWDFVNRRINEKPTALTAIDSAISTYNLESDQAPATAFVLLVGKFLDLRDNEKDIEGSRRILKDIQRISSTLGIQGSALLEQAISQSRSRITDATSGARRRGATTSARQVRSKF
ncbi:MAG: hypothetical protein NUV81_01040 [bacterium]|nr:hypothetical protein [bacterium]